MERDLRPFVRPVSKGRFRTLLSGYSNFATLNLSTAVMQLKAFTWVDFISPCGYHSLYIYNKVYSIQWVCSFSVYIGTMPWCVYISSLAWAGLTLLILTWGQCEGLIFGISTRETYSHVFFVSIILMFEFGQQGERWPAPLCAPMSARDFLIYTLTLFTNLKFKKNYGQERTEIL